MAQGKVYGYDKRADGTYKINPREARAVKALYLLAALGLSMETTAALFNLLHIPPAPDPPEGPMPDGLRNPIVSPELFNFVQPGLDKEATMLEKVIIECAHFYNCWDCGHAKGGGCSLWGEIDPSTKGRDENHDGRGE